MSDNKDVVRRMFDELVNQGDYAVMDELYDPEFQTTTPQGTLDLAGFRAFVEGWRAAFPDIKCEVADLIAEGDQVSWTVRATGTQSGDFMGIPATGRSVDFDSLNLATFKDGRAYRHRVLMDTGTMLQQLGVAPPA